MLLIGAGIWLATIPTELQAQPTPQHAAQFEKAATLLMSLGQPVSIAEADKWLAAVREALRDNSSDQASYMRALADLQYAASVCILGESAKSRDAALRAEKRLQSLQPRAAESTRAQILGERCAALMVVAESLTAEGREQEATAQYERIIMLSDGSTQQQAVAMRGFAHMRIGERLAIAGELKPAIQPLSDAIEELGSLRAADVIVRGQMAVCIDMLQAIQILGAPADAPSGLEGFEESDRLLPWNVVDIAIMECHLKRATWRSAAFEHLGRMEEALAVIRRADRAIRRMPLQPEQLLALANLLTAKSDLLCAAGRLEDELETRERVIAMLTPLRPNAEIASLRARNHLSISTSMGMRGRVTEALTSVRAAGESLELLPQDDDVANMLRIQQQSILSHMLWFTGDSVGAREALRAASATAEHLSDAMDPSLRVMNSCAIASAAAALGDRKLSADATKRTIALWNRINEREEKARIGIDIFSGVALAAFWRSDFEEFRGYVERAMDCAQEVAADPATRSLLATLGAMAASQGGVSALGDIERAIQRLEAEPFWGSDEVLSVMKCLRGFALAQDPARSSEAAPAMAGAVRDVWRWVGMNMPGLSDGAKQVFLQKRIPGLEVIYAVALSTNRPEAGLEVALLRKSLFSEMARREHQGFLHGTSNEWREKWKRYNALRSMAVQPQGFGGERVPGGTEAEVVKNEIKRLETELRQSNIAFDSALTIDMPQVADVASRLDPDDALLEFVRFPDLGENLSTTGASRYGVFVLRHDGRIRGFDLGPAAEIDAAVEELKSDLTPSHSERLVRDASSALRRLVWDPIAAGLDGVKRVFIVPESQLCEVPFECLALPGEPSGTIRYLVETTEIVYLPTGRQLLQRHVGELEAEQKRLVVLLGDPDYFATAQRRRAAVEELRRMGWPRMSGPVAAPLDRAPDPGTGSFNRVEETGLLIRSLAARLEVPRNVIATPLEGPYADKQSLLLAQSAQCIVIATHGMAQIPEVEARPKGRLAEGGTIADEILGDALLWSRLALAGANLSEADPAPGAADRPERQFAQGPSPNAETGLLTGREIAALDLSGTELVVLVACEGALIGGDRNGLTGEGIHGLAKAFWTAGAKCVVASLWEVPVDSTIPFMGTFVENALLGDGSRYEAFRAAQLEAIAKLRATDGRAHPYSWAGFVFQGTP